MNITMDQFLMSRVKLADLSPQMQANANLILARANALLTHFGSYRNCNSGYRSAEDQMRINPKVTHSKHMECLAIDLEDRDRHLTNFCLKNLALLESIGLWMESPATAVTWVHIQASPPHSGNRVFIP